MGKLTRRAAILGAAVSTVALAVPAVASVGKDDALTHQMIGAFVSLPLGKQVDALRLIRDQGMNDLADALHTLMPSQRRPTTLEELSRKFAADAKAIDRTIREVWIGNDQTPAHRGEIFSISFDRRQLPRRRKAV